MRQKILYEIVIVDTPEQRDILNKVFTSSPTYKCEAVSVGQSLHGKNYGGQRINLVNDRTKQRPINFKWWYAMRRYFDKDVRFI